MSMQVSVAAASTGGRAESSVPSPATRIPRTLSTTSSSEQRQICRYFRNGLCKFGANCFYSHDLSALDTSSQAARAPTVCRYFLEGNCRYGNKCLFDHVTPPSSQASGGQAVAAAASSATSVGATTSSSQAAADATKYTPVVRMLNKPKLVTTSFFPSDSKASSSESNSADPPVGEVGAASSQPTSYFEALTGVKKTETAYEEAPGMFDENYMEYLQRKSQAASAQGSTAPLCPYFEKSLECPFGEECAYIHGDFCDVCNMPCLHPYDEKQRDEHRAQCLKEMERDMEEAFAVQCSAEKVCGICMEVVWAKENHSLSDMRFGILENCNHIFCLPCIRKWRSSKSYENKVVKACPECRVKSDFVTPSRYWFENEEQKKKIINEYKTQLGNTHCKYFKKGDGECPFGNKCFYLHENKDGTKAILPEPTKRHRINHSGLREAFTNLIHIDFDYDYDRLDLEDDDEMDDFALDLLELLRLNMLNSDSEWSNETLEELRSYFEQ